LELTGRTESGNDTWVQEFSATSERIAGGQISWKGTAELLVHGDLEVFDASGGTIVCSAFVPPSPLAVPLDVDYIPSFDGTIKCSGAERKGIRWNTSLGAAEFIDYYEYEPARVGLDQALMRVQRCRVNIRYEPAGTVSLRSIVTTLQEELDEPLWVLSFLSRRRLAWYEADIHFRPAQGQRDGEFRQVTVRQKQWLGFESERQREMSWVGLLVKRDALIDQLFEQMLENYRVSEFKEVIRQVIPFVLAAHETGYTETRLGILYSGLEALISGLCRDDGNQGSILDRQQFSQLRRKLNEVVKQEVHDNSCAQMIIDRLGNLNQRSYADRLLALAGKHGVDLRKLWPSGADIASEVKMLIRRRNTYIHQGRIDDYGVHYVDLYRIQNLIELWILKLLDYPDTAINDFAINHPVPLNR